MSDDKIFTKFGQALKEARLTSGLSQEELALQSELDRTYVSMLERGVKIPTLTTLGKLSKSLSISPVDLISRSLRLENQPFEGKSNKRNNLNPPFFGTSVSCGKAISEEFKIDREISLDEEVIKKPEETFFVKASGDSMSPTIWDGDLLMVSFKKKPSNGSIIVASLNHEFTVKRFFKTSKGIKLVPDNGSYQEINISEDSELSVSGVVIGLIRNI